MKRMLAVVSVLPLVALAACSGSAAHGGGSSDTVKVAVISPIESQVVSMPYVRDSVVAGIEAINAAGGVNGKKIEYTTCNDKYDVEALRGCLQDAVRDGAVAVLGLVTPYGAQVWPMLEQANLPVIGHAPLAREDANSKVAFPVDGGTIGYIGAATVATELYESKKAVPMHIDQAQASTTQTYFEFGAENAGLELADAITVPVDAVDYAPFVKRAESSGADTILSALSAETNLKLWQALKATGSELHVITSSGAAPEAIIKEAGDAAEGSFVIAGTPPIDDSVPASKQFLEEMAEFQPTAQHTAVGLRAWAGVHLFAHAAEKIDGEITRDALVDALNSIDGEEFLWIDSLSYKKPGQFDQAPRVPSWLVFTSKVDANGVAVPSEVLDPFAN